MWGKHIEAQIEKVKDKNKKKKHVNMDQLIQRELTAILHPPPKKDEKASGEKPKPAKGHFRDPAEMIGKR